VTLPENPAQAEISFAGRRSQQTLVAIHEHLREELDRLGDMVDQLRAGSLDPGVARSHIAQMTMRQNAWTVGAYCASYCRLLTLHHTIEDERMFVDLRAGEPSLGPVIDQLAADHVTISGVMDEVDQALVGLVGLVGAGRSGRDGIDAVESAVGRLTEQLLRHLEDEETALLGAIGRLSLAL
jgi:HAMP domain-containing protein